MAFSLSILSLFGCGKRDICNAASSDWPAVEVVGNRLPPAKKRQRNKLQMNTTNITINKGEWLSNVMKEIPTNTILNKVMTGCGATTLEINAARHSIIIEPNVPVIIGKKAQHDFLFAVYRVRRAMT